MIIERVDATRLFSELPVATSRETEIVVVMPFTDEDAATRSAQLMAARSGISHGVILQIQDSEAQGFISLVNTAFAVTNSRFFAFVAQDAYAGRRWLQRGVAALEKNGRSLLAFNDGKWMGALAGFGLVRREWAASNYSGELFYPGYRRHYADVELTVLAMSSEQVCYDANSVLIEVDWDKDQKAVDSADRETYLQRAGGGFDGRVTSQKLLGLFS